MSQIIKLLAWFAAGYFTGWALVLLYVGAVTLFGGHR